MQLIILQTNVGKRQCQNKILQSLQWVISKFGAVWRRKAYISLTAKQSLLALVNHNHPSGTSSCIWKIGTFCSSWECCLWFQIYFCQGYRYWCGTLVVFFLFCLLAQVHIMDPFHYYIQWTKSDLETLG